MQRRIVIAAALTPTVLLCALAAVLWMAGYVQFALPAEAPPRRQFVDDLGKSSDIGTTINVGDVSYRLPFAFPPRDEMLRALPASARSKNARIQCDLVLYQLDAPKIYPDVGRASLMHAHFKFTVFTDRGSDVGYIDRDRLIPVK
jgi:hypothetical protein